MNDIADGFDGSMVGNDIPRGTKYDTGADDGTTDDVGILLDSIFGERDVDGFLVNVNVVVTPNADGIEGSCITNRRTESKAVDGWNRWRMDILIDRNNVGIGYKDWLFESVDIGSVMIMNKIL